MTATKFKLREANVAWALWAAVFGLMLVGTAFIYSAKLADSLPWYRDYYFKQLIWYGIGAVAAVGSCLVDYTRLARWSLVGYWGAIILLILVLIPGIGTWHGGSRRWLDFGPVSLQPSEFAKLAFIFAQAHFLSRPLEELRWRSVFWQSIAMTTLPFLLILKEPDLGSALVFFPVGLVMMLVAGVPEIYLAKLVGVAGLVIGLVLVDVLVAPAKLQFVKLEPYQRQRLLVYFGQDFAPKNATPAEKRYYQRLENEKSYNIRQALISVGSGGMFGKGWGEGTQNNLGYLPRAVAHNDFIFSVIAEEKGFLGSMVVIGLYTVILFSGLRIASQARDRLGKILAVGVVTLIFCHVFINIGMNIGLMPVTGIPLPLLSYGGSSVLISLIAAGILQNIQLYRRAY